MASSATCSVEGTVGQTVVGDSADDSGNVGIFGGFWFTLPSVNVPVEGASFGTLTESGTVLIRWIVGSIAEVVGFNVYRSTSNAGPFVRVNDFTFPAEPQGSYEDCDIWPETIFWYEVRALRPDGTEDVVSGSPFFVATGGHLVCSLLPPYPNPFLEESVIQFEIPRGNHQVRLAVYGVSGRLVKELAAGPSSGGRYTARWDGTEQRGQRAAPGVYFVRLDVGSESRTRKTLLIR